MLDKLINVSSHVFHGCDVVLVLIDKSLLELVSEQLLVLNNLFASSDLHIDILGEFLAVFFLFEFLPVPVDFDVFLVGGDDLILNLVSAFLALLLFFIAAEILSLVDVGLNTSDRLVSLPTHLFNVA